MNAPPSKSPGNTPAKAASGETRKAGSPVTRKPAADPQLSAASKVLPAIAKPAASTEIQPVAKTRAAPPQPATQKPAPQKTPPQKTVPTTVPVSQFHRRHFWVLLSFLLAVVLPALLSAWYLWTRAADQFASNVGFSVRAEDQGSSIASLLGPLAVGGSSSTPDAAILHRFIQSQSLVETLDKKLDLRAIWSKADPSVDPVFSYHPPGTIEDLLDHWERKVRVNYNSSSGLIEVQVLAFTAEDAKSVSEAIYVESTEIINELSAVAQADAIGYARDELTRSVERLKEARTALTQFRNRTQVVDPTIDLQSQAGLLSTLNQQLAAALIELDLLEQTTRSNDPRVVQAERKVDVVEARILEEKKKLGFGTGDDDDGAFASLVGEYERLTVDREFAEQTYTAALAAFDLAQAEARRQSRYLAAHVSPTLAERAEYPQRLTLFGLIVLFSFLTWGILVLIAYSLRDRR